MSSTSSTRSASPGRSPGSGRLASSRADRALPGGRPRAFRLGEGRPVPYHHAHEGIREPGGERRMKCLIVYCVGGQWFGEEVSWKRSGSGTYREVSRIEIPQSRAEIEKFARENRY